MPVLKPNVFLRVPSCPWWLKLFPSTPVLPKKSIRPIEILDCTSVPH